MRETDQVSRLAAALDPLRTLIGSHGHLLFDASHFQGSMPIVRLAQVDEVPKLAMVERAAASIFRDVGLAWIAEGELLEATYLIKLCEQQMLWVAVDDDGAPVGFLVVKIKRESPLPYESFQRFARSLRVPSV